MAEGQKVLAGAAAMSFLPLRKPSATVSETAGAEALGIEGIGDAEEVTAVAESSEAEPGPSQAVADSDKTAPPKNKATQ
ncbi:hypothetical protein AUC71_03505 [Methyloceanibacter marginalis]|uniref:Uncharacterized protein n=1 Tax=Methyloceanibacter marginalis TaxID=1774971 RepID=A0A1E3W368_9HYPH|nr:hypothetical protein [Methyloceanibacter marginalis]ODS00255.1 hypothetical protein AUC71_03505 [Methyloceanibacter marginalis]